MIVLELDRENRRMSLGHKQLEENPWEVFETIFAVGSAHTATVLKIDGNQALVALPYGLEGSCHTKHLQKADGTAMQVDEAGEFVVLEFNRNAKRITVSHLRTHDEGPKKKETKERKPRPAGGGNRMMEEVNSNIERSTFGDLSVLSALKEQMEGGPEETDAPAQAAAAPAADTSTEGEATSPSVEEETGVEDAGNEAQDAPVSDSSEENSNASDSDSDDADGTYRCFFCNA